MSGIIDTHCHLYLEEFNLDRNQVIVRARNAGVVGILLPNVDLDTVPGMLRVADMYPDFCFPMMGLHPTSVDGNYKKVLSSIERYLGERSYVAVGEIGLDLYWDRTYFKEQQDAFLTQLKWARELNLPVSMHVRDAFAEVRTCLDQIDMESMKGVFHCFSGTKEDACWVLNRTPFYFGVTGTVTYKNSSLPIVFTEVPLDKLLIETDAPYLSPVPYRGKKNEPAYLQKVVERLSFLYNVDEETLKQTVEKGAKYVFERIYGGGKLLKNTNREEQQKKQ